MAQHDPTVSLSWRAQPPAGPLALNFAAYKRQVQIGCRTVMRDRLERAWPGKAPPGEARGLDRAARPPLGGSSCPCPSPVSS